MRNELQMLSLILEVAREDERVRAVYMNGSRTNSMIVKDNFRDYDVVFVVDETGSFLERPDWINVFGKRLILQEPDSNDFGWGDKKSFLRSYAWLMLLEDGNRIDLTLLTKEYALAEYGRDTLTIKLLDKDDILPELPPPTDRGYWVKKPTEARYKGCCNDFWWCMQNIVKGTARDELPYAMRMFNLVRGHLETMLEWYVGCENDFSVSTGKFGKHLKKYLSKELYESYLSTFPKAEASSIWNAVYSACELFRYVARMVAGALGFVFDRDEDAGMTEYINRVKSGEFGS